MGIFQRNTLINKMLKRDMSSLGCMMANGKLVDPRSFEIRISYG
jgi:hypothetical protein